MAVDKTLYKHIFFNDKARFLRMNDTFVSSLLTIKCVSARVIAFGTHALCWTMLGWTVLGWTGLCWAG
eukprot:scaffold158568_cov50-Attheya_sp.AAC.1